MRVNDDYKTVNVEAQRAFSSPDDLSVLQFWKRALENRKKHKDVFVYGNYKLLDDEHKTIFAYKRASKTEAFVVVLNFSAEEVEWQITSDAKVKKWAAGNYTTGEVGKSTEGMVKLRPYEVSGSLDMWCFGSMLKLIPHRLCLVWPSLESRRYLRRSRGAIDDRLDKVDARIITKVRMPGISFCARKKSLSLKPPPSSSTADRPTS